MFAPRSFLTSALCRIQARLAFSLRQSPGPGDWSLQARRD